MILKLKLRSCRHSNFMKTRAELSSRRMAVCLDCGSTNMFEMDGPNYGWRGWLAPHLWRKN